MEKSFLLRKLSFLLVLVVMVFPFLHLGFYVPMQIIKWDPFIIDVAKGALIQTALSTMITMVLGILGALGLISLKKMLSPSVFKICSYLILVPSFVPPIVLVATGAKALGFLPTGLVGVVFYHSLMNTGLMSFILYTMIQRKSQLWLKEAIVANIKPSRFLIRGLLPELKADLKVLAFYFSTLYFFSFSIPFLVGGSLYGGIEVFIYEKILFFGQWGEAIQYSASLFLLLLILSRFVSGGEENSLLQAAPDNPYLDYLSFRILGLVPLFPVLVLIVGLVQSLFSNWFALDPADFFMALRGTLLIGLLAGFIVFVLFALLAYSFLNERMSKLFVAMIHPGWVIVGFSFLLMEGGGVGLSFIKIGLALSVLYLPFLYRLSFYQSLKDLKNQVRVAQTFPVSWSKIFKTIIWPQCLPTVCLLSGVAALWACGDFAMTEILIGSSGSTTLALEMKTLIASYRLEQAIALLLPLLVSSFIVFLIFQGLSYVGRRDFIS